MQINRSATTHTVSVQADVSIREAAELMQSLNIGFLLVTEGKSIVGVLTDRDIVIRSVATGSCLRQSTTVREIMSFPVVSISGLDDLDAAADLMRKKKVRRLVVTNDSNEPVGVLSLDDLAFSTHGDNTTGHVLVELAHGPQSATFNSEEIVAMIGFQLIS